VKISRELSEQLSSLMDEIRDDYNLTIKLTQDLFIHALGSPVIKEDLCNHFDSLLGIDEEPDSLDIPSDEELDEDDLDYEEPGEDEDEDQN